jgi:hypothetical protein
MVTNSPTNVTKSGSYTIRSTESYRRGDRIFEIQIDRLSDGRYRERVQVFREDPPIAPSGPSISEGEHTTFDLARHHAMADICAWSPK